jgi:hypothetical protein
VATLERAYYRLPRGVVHGALLWVLLAAIVLAGLAWTTAPRWLPLLEYQLDVDASVAAPDAVILRSNGEGSEAEQLAARAVRDGRARTLVLLGQPFTPDELLPVGASRRLPRLLALGVPRSAIVEIYAGDTQREEMLALRTVARERRWHGVLFYVTRPGTRRDYLIARRTLDSSGIAVGQVTLPGQPALDPDNWWRDERSRSRVANAWVSLLYTLASSEGT